MLTHDFEIVFQYIEIQLLRYLHCKDILRNVADIRYKHGLCCGTPRNGIFMPVNIFIIFCISSIINVTLLEMFEIVQNFNLTRLT